MSSELRTLILDNVKTRLDAAFGPQGTEGQWFRDSWRGPWIIGRQSRPYYCISDFGAKRSENLNSNTQKNRVLSFHVILGLNENWERVDEHQDWTDRVEKIAAKVQNYKAAGGMKRLDYISDDPFEVVLESGQSEGIWVIEFEAEYWMDVGAFG
jgi:hypothetical protein